MKDEEQKLAPVESLATLYLTAPLFVFFAAFVRVEIAIPACGLVAFQAFQIIRRTAWGDVALLRGWETLWFFVFAAALLSWLYGAGSLHQNGDWFKHYSVLNFLVQHPWPAEARIEGIGESALRYYLGWYLVPALFLKLTGGAPLQQFALTAWSTAGLFLFFKLLSQIIGTPRLTLVVPLAFMIFGGADLIGLLLVQEQPRDFPFIEWWSGWIQYSSNITAIAWVPQHTIPAWLGAALLMSQRARAPLLPFLPLVSSAILLWSPFAALGLIPFLSTVILRNGARTMLLDWRSTASALLIALPIGVYLLSASGDVPRGFIGSSPCTFGTPCFTWPSYLLFIGVEVGLPIAFLFMARIQERGFLIAAVLTVALIPLYKIGMNNDFGMRASLPALAVLGMLCTKVLVVDTKRHLGMLAVGLLALPEFYVGMSLPVLDYVDAPSTTTFGDSFQLDEQFMRQYFTPLPQWILR